MNNIIKQTFYLILLSLILGFIRYVFLEEYQFFNAGNKTIVKVQDNSDLENYLLNLDSPDIVSIETAKLIYDKELAIFIDARDYVEYIDGHIKNSLNLPFSPENEYNESLLDSLYNADKTLIVYCSGEDCTLSQDLTNYLYEERNFYSIIYFEEGFPVWKEKDYPVKSVNVSNKIEVDNISFFSFIDYLVIISLIVIFSLFISGHKAQYIPHVSRIVLGFIFIYFSWDKILDPKLFANVIKNYDIIPFGLENFGALFLPYIEFLIGVCLILGVFLDMASFISLFLLALFILMISQAYIRGKSIDCGCLLSDLSNISSSEKRLHMLMRILQDICFIMFALMVKYRTYFRGK